MVRHLLVEPMQKVARKHRPLELRRSLLALPLALLTGFVGCSPKVTHADCEAIKRRMLEVWDKEAKVILGETPLPKELEAAAREGQELAAGWNAQCEGELLGRRVEPKELACLRGATTLEAFAKCEGL